MNKKSTLILLSSIFMSGLAARPTLQDVRKAIPTLKDVRNTVTVRNACKVAGGAAGGYAGVIFGGIIGHLMYAGLDVITGSPAGANNGSRNGATIGALAGTSIGLEAGEKLHDTIATMQDVRNAATPRNAYRLAGGAAGFFVGAKIGYYIYADILDYPSYLRIQLPYLGGVFFEKLEPFVCDSRKNKLLFQLGTNQLLIDVRKTTRTLRILPTVAAFTGATLGARLSGATYDKAAKKLTDRRASNNN